jgi:hypothetical protein
LQKNESGLYRACLTLGVLGVTFLILKVYFDRAMKFLDPHFTIMKIAKRASKLLKRIQRLERAVQGEVRYQIHSSFRLLSYRSKSCKLWFSTSRIGKNTT